MNFSCCVVFIILFFSVNELLFSQGCDTLVFSLPLETVHFENFTGANLSEVHPGWIEGDLEGELATNWTADDFANDVDHINGRAARFRFDNSLGVTNSAIVSPYFNCTENSFLRFRMAVTLPFVSDTASFDEGQGLWIMIKEACDTASVFWQAPQSGPEEYWYALEEFAGKEIQIAFVVESSLATEPRSLFIDRIDILELPSLDLGLVDIIIPENLGCSNEEQEIVFRGPKLWSGNNKSGYRGYYFRAWDFGKRYSR